MSAAYTWDPSGRGRENATNAAAAIALKQTIATNGSARFISLPDDERASPLSNTPCQGRGESLVRSLAGWLKGQCDRGPLRHWSQVRRPPQAARISAGRRPP